MQADGQVPEIDPAEARDMVEGGAMLLDVREPDEWAAGHAPGAVHVPLARLPDRVPTPDDGRTVVAVCRSGARSERAAAFLRQRGVDAINLRGGMRAWVADGGPIVDREGSPGRVV